MTARKFSPSDASASASSARHSTTKSASQVHDFHGWREQNAMPTRPDRGAEIDVFGVHEESFVEQADGLRGIAAHEQTRSAHPVGIAPFAREPLDSAALRETLLAQLVQRRNHAPEGELGAAAGIHEARADDRNRVVCVEL